jgi:hypothetical protein
MALNWIHDVPNWLLGLLMVATFGGGAALGLLATRGSVRRLYGPPPGHNEVVSYYLGAFGVFYGLALGLIAVATWQNFVDLGSLVAEEAAALRVLDANVTRYPPPVRGALHQRLLEYTDFVIREEWPAQRRGVALDAGQERLTAFGDALETWEPATAGQEALHEETLRAYDRYLDLHRRRLFRLGEGLPAVVWVVLLVGAVVSVALTGLFSLESLPGHVVLTVLLAGFLGLVIFLIVAMDHPYRGEFSVGPDDFVAVRRHMLARGAPAP